MKPALTLLLRHIDTALESPGYSGEQKVRLFEARSEIQRACAELRDLDRPRPPIHARICRILILVAEGGLLD